MRMPALRQQCHQIFILGFLAVGLAFPAFSFERSVVTIGSRQFDVELAVTPDQQRQGLMHREELKEGHGMLFIFDKEQQASMWMKNTLIPLDMLFIDKAGVIRTIKENATPGSLEPISSGVPVKAVLELKGGITEQLGISTGDTIDHEIFIRHSR